MKRYPILRLLLPYLAGIVIGHCLGYSTWAWVIGAVGLSAFVLMNAFGHRSMSFSYKIRPWYVVPISLMAMGLGWWNMSQRFVLDPALDSASDKGIIVRIDQIERRDFGMSITVETMHNELLLLTTQGCDYTIEAGDLLSVKGHPEPIVNRGNPGEMDYAAMMRLRGISHELHLRVRDLVVVGHDDTWQTRLTRWRSVVARRIYASRLDPSTARTVVALTLGERHQIDAETRTSLSQSGLSHLMALSGLHVSMVALLVWWLLWPIDYVLGRRVRLGFTLVVMTGFVFLVGMPASVVRAWVMMAVALVPALFYRKTYSMNGLMLAATFILVVWPESLFSVGFQFSFITVWTLLLLSRHIDTRRLTSWRVVNYLAGLAVVSLTAMLATSILSAYYFHSIALTSMVSNLLAIPVFVVFMIGCAACTLLFSVGADWPLLDSFVNTLHGYVMGVSDMVSGWSWAHLDHVWVDMLTVWCYYGLMGCLVTWLIRQQPRWLLVGLTLGIVAVADNIVVQHQRPTQGLVVLNDYSATPIVYWENRRGFVWVPDDETYDSTRFTNNYHGLIARFGLDTVNVVNVEHGAQATGSGIISPPLAFLNGRHIGAVGRERWLPGTLPSGMDSLDLLVVSHRCHRRLEGTGIVKHSGVVVLSGAMPRIQSDSLSRQAAATHHTAYPLSQKGALVID